MISAWPLLTINCSASDESKKWLIVLISFFNASFTGKSDGSIPKTLQSFSLKKDRAVPSFEPISTTNKSWNFFTSSILSYKISFADHSKWSTNFFPIDDK